MISYETHVLPNSDYYVYTPSTLAKKLFFYPICTGSFRYESGYRLARDSYDSFLLMYILKGTCFVTVDDQTMQATAGQLVLLDCYAPHAYGTDSGFEALWLHFDGPIARNFYETIVPEKGSLLYPTHPDAIYRFLYNIYDTFRSRAPIAEDQISITITNILMDLLTAETTQQATRKTQTDISDAIITTRMANAKFLLKTSQMSVKEIAIRSGFSDESGFCTAFKKQEGMTPNEYRNTVC